jgi:hypothetical protein
MTPTNRDANKKEARLSGPLWQLRSSSVVAAMVMHVPARTAMRKPDRHGEMI